MHIRKQFRFEAAHVLPHHTGKCSRLHGHSYRLEVTVAGTIRAAGPATGMVEDFASISEIVRRTVIDRVDHRLLNDLLPNPTAELIVIWIWEQLTLELSGLIELVLWETPTSSVVCRAEDVASYRHEDPNHARTR